MNTTLFDRRRRSRSRCGSCLPDHGAALRICELGHARTAMGRVQLAGRHGVRRCGQSVRGGMGYGPPRLAHRPCRESYHLCGWIFRPFRPDDRP